MAMFVHLTSTADAPRVRRAGLRADSRDPVELRAALHWFSVNLTRP